MLFLRTSSDIFSRKRGVVRIIWISFGFHSCTIKYIDEYQDVYTFLEALIIVLFLLGMYNM